MQFNNGITIVGSGNVASHLAFEFASAGIRINSIISRKEEHARQLALKYGADFSTRLDDVPGNTSLVLLCVSDDAIEEVSNNIAKKNIPVVHTAGSIPLTAVAARHHQAGVFYPVQSFSGNVRLGKLSFPVCVEASTNELLENLELLSATISKKSYRLDSEQRKYVHLAAVITNNFTNYFITLAFDLLESKKIDTSLLQPLMDETVAKINTIHPANAQTGPARRGNSEVLQFHEQLLGLNPGLRDLYKIISKSIMDYFKREK